MSDDIWGILQIAPSSDPAVIRSAYAVRLKRVRPDDDPAGFTQLRGAYEAAIRYADATQSFAAPGPAAAMPPRPQDQPPAPARPPDPSPTARSTQIERQIETMIRAGDLDAAMERLRSTDDDTMLPLGPWMRLSELLAQRLLHDGSVPPAQRERVAIEMGWHGATVPFTSKTVEALRQRIDGERWLAATRADAAKWTRFVGNENAAASAMLFGRGPLGIAGILPPITPLRALLSAAQAHGVASHDSLDTERLGHLRRLVADPSRQHKLRMLCAIVVMIAFLASGDLRAGFLATSTVMVLRSTWTMPFAAFALCVASMIALAHHTGDTRLQTGMFYLMLTVIGGLAARAMLAASRFPDRRQLRVWLLKIACVIPPAAVDTALWSVLGPTIRSHRLGATMMPLTAVGVIALYWLLFNTVRRKLRW